MSKVLDILAAAIPVVTVVFVVSSMLGMGLGLTVAQMTAPLRNVRLVAMSLLANFVVMPASALMIASVLGLNVSHRIGLIILGVAAGAPFLPKLAEMARGNVAFGMALMVLLMIVTVGYLPLVLPLLLPGVNVHPGGIARSLVVLMLLPLAAALAVKGKAPAFAGRVKPALDHTSSLALVLVVVLLIVVNIEKVLSVIGTRAILAGMVFIAIGYAVGWAVGGPCAEQRVVLGLGTAQRNIAAALVVGGQSFSDPGVVVMVIVVAIASLLVLMPLSRFAASRRASPT